MTLSLAEIAQMPDFMTSYVGLPPMLQVEHLVSHGADSETNYRYALEIPGFEHLNLRCTLVRYNRYVTAPSHVVTSFVECQDLLTSTALFGWREDNIAREIRFSEIGASGEKHFIWSGLYWVDKIESYIDNSKHTHGVLQYAVTLRR